MLRIYFWVWLLNSCAIYGKIPHQHQPIFLQTKWKCWHAEQWKCGPKTPDCWTWVRHYVNSLPQWSIASWPVWLNRTGLHGDRKIKDDFSSSGVSLQIPILPCKFFICLFLSSSSFNCLFLHMHGEVGWTCLLIFLCSCKEENNCFSQQFTWTDSSEQVQLQEENIKKPFWNWQFLPI